MVVMNDVEVWPPFWLRPGVEIRSLIVACHTGLRRR